MNPTIKLILTFLVGLLSGATLVVVFYLLLMMFTVKKRSYVIEAQNKDIKEQEILELIKQCQENYKFASKSSDKTIKDGAFQRNIVYLAEQIALKFFPNSKRPLAELTVDEMLVVTRYISLRIEEIIDRPGLRRLKGMSLNTIIDITQAKKKIENSKVVEVADKYQAKSIMKGILMALNCVNPVYWFKKLVIDNVVDRVVNKIKLMAISISGQELYKVYSKKAFESANGSEIDEELLRLEEELKEPEKPKKFKKQ